ncbi:MAG: hypothetical protein R2766_06480 [Saprospiraceae bacterium]
MIGRTASERARLPNLLRMYDPDQGRITINGEDIKSFSFEELRSLVGYVFHRMYFYFRIRYQMTSCGANQNIEA